MATLRCAAESQRPGDIVTPFGSGHAIDRNRGKRAAATGSDFTLRRAPDSVSLGFRNQTGSVFWQQMPLGNEAVGRHFYGSNVCFFGRISLFDRKALVSGSKPFGLRARERDEAAL